jgi:hypothetical protein
VSRSPATQEPLANHVDARATNLEPGRAIGPIRMGMLRADVAAVLGTKPEVAADSPEYDQFYNRGLEIQYDDTNHVVGIHAYSAVRAGYETRERTPFPLAGPNGIHWGSTYDEVIAAMGAPGYAGDLSSAPVPTKYLTYGDVMFDFTMSDNRLFHVVVFNDTHVDANTNDDPPPPP